MQSRTRWFLMSFRALELYHPDNSALPSYSTTLCTHVYLMMVRTCCSLGLLLITSNCCSQSSSPFYTNYAQEITVESRIISNAELAKPQWDSPSQSFRTEDMLLHFFPLRQRPSLTFMPHPSMISWGEYSEHQLRSGLGRGLHSTGTDLLSNLS